MQINYKETSADLQKRIEIHEKYGTRNIDDWNLEVLNPQPGFTILDVGCGAGKQCFLFDAHTKGKAEIFGGDFSEELLGKANEKLQKLGNKNINFQFLDFNKPFEFSDGKFDLVTSSFAIYYAADLKFTFSEAYRVLNSGGRLFVTGPLPENKKMFYDIIKEATNKVIPPMPGSSRFKGEILNTIDGIFDKTELLTWENPLVFPEVEPFMEYVHASLNEDRKLWTDLFNSPEEYKKMISSIQEVAVKWHQRDGKLVMTKVVGGILATKK